MRICAIRDVLETHSLAAVCEAFVGIPSLRLRDRLAQSYFVSQSALTPIFRQMTSGLLVIRPREVPQALAIRALAEKDTNQYFDAVSERARFSRVEGCLADATHSQN